MSRFALEREPARDSFAGLLEHLAGNINSGTAESGTHSKPRSVAGANSHVHPGAASETGPGGRPLLPVAELKSGRGNSVTAKPLSYEDALRLHNRRGSQAANELPVPGADARRVESLRAASVPVPALDRVAGKNAAPRPSSGFAQRNGAPSRAANEVLRDRVPATGSQETNSPTLQNPAKSSPQGQRQGSAQRPDPRSEKGSMQNPAQNPAGSRRASKTRPSTRSKKSASSSSGPIADHGSTESIAHAPSSQRVPTGRRDRGKCLQSPPLRAEWKDDPNLPSASMKGTIQKIERSPAVATLQPSQRRVIVSLRLTEGEIARLRDRADESGISVSAYMRSCIVDADQLRSQVKRALAEMRAYTAKPEGESYPALAVGGRSNSFKTSFWFPLFLRFAATCFRPLFPFRRSA